MLTRESRILVGEGREELHPLCNYGILHNIFRHFDVETLKSVRGICTFWNEQAKSLLQIRAKITVTWYTEVEKKERPTLLTFMKYVESVTPENVFFRNYELHDWCLHSKEKEMTQFWLKCGHCIRNLTLRSSRNSLFGFYEQSYVENVFYNWTPNMESLQLENVRFLNAPNYKRFSFVKRTTRRRYVNVDTDECHSAEATDSDAEDADVSSLEPMKKSDIRANVQPNYNFHTFAMRPSYRFPVLPFQWKELFVAFPNLKSLSLVPVSRKDGVEDVDIIDKLLTDLIEFQEENPDKLQNLKHLDVFSPLTTTNIFSIMAIMGTRRFRERVGCPMTVTNKHFEQAMKLKFKMESLRICLNEVEELSYDIGQYLGKLSPTLKTLDITWFDQGLTTLRMGNNISFPCLKDLTIGLNALSCINMDFLEKLSALEKLTIGNLLFGLPQPRSFFSAITILTMNSLRHLHVGVDILTVDCVRKIGEWFPNLSYFGAILDDPGLWAVYKFLYNSVEELNITGKRVTDAGITGMEGSYDSDNSTSSDSEYKDAEVGTCIGVSIGQMKKLRHVSIRGNPYSPVTERDHLTDDSMYNGFFLLTELTYLELRFCEESITEEAYRDLCSRRNIITLDTTHFYRGYGTKVTECLFGRTQSTPRIEI